MTKTRATVLGASLLSVAAVGIANVGSSGAQTAPITVEVLTPRSVLTDDVDLKLKLKHHGEERQVVNSKDPSRTLVARFTIQPGAKFPWHTHPGSVIVNVTQGELVYVAADDCVRRSYKAGEAFVDIGHGHVHSATNPTDAPTVIVATFYEMPAAPAPITNPVDPPADCQI